MRINIRLLIAGSVLVLTAVAAFFLFSSFNGKYAFLREPQLMRDQVTLNKTPTESREPLTDRFFREKLQSDVQKQAYDTLAEYVLDADTSLITLDETGKDDLQMAVNAFRGDYPEVFWLDYESGYKYYDNGYSVVVEFTFTETGDELWEDRQLLEEAVSEVIEGAPQSASDYEIELYLNSCLCDGCQYNEEAANRHSSFGALVEGQAVCDGYSRAFQLLCRRFGIECTVVEGSSDFNGDGDGGHMWNCVNLGGSWYHIDVTWNDVPDAGCEAERYFYCNLTTEQIEKDHIISGGYEEYTDDPGSYFNIFVPDCDCDDLNYMRLNFCTVKDPSDDDQIVASLVDAARNKSSWCAFLVDESEDFSDLTNKITRDYASEWVRGANRFLDGDSVINSEGRVIVYENKRVIAFLLTYRETAQ